jgi:prevent-host-death family protein
MRDLRNKTAEIMRIVEGRNQVIITKRGRGAAVIVDFSEYEEYEKYLHEKYVERNLNASLQQALDPSTKFLTHDSLSNEYNVMAADKEREAEAAEWCNAHTTDGGCRDGRK